jgi:hypothetical protein
VSPTATKAGEVAAAPLLNKTVGELLSDQKAKYEHKDVLVVSHQDIKWTHVGTRRYSPLALRGKKTARRD